MNLTHYSYKKRFDILKHFPFPYYPYIQHKNSDSDKNLSCKLAPISLERKYVRETLPSINQLHIIDIEDHETMYSLSSPQSQPSSLISNYPTSSSPMLSSTPTYHTPTNETYLTPNTIDYGNKIKLHVSKRTYISDEQTLILNNYYKRNNFPNRDDRFKLSKQLNLLERTVQIWFQNKRQNRSKKL